MGASRKGDMPPRACLSKWLGALAQLGERYNGIVEVSGSIPLSSTKLFDDLTQKFLGLTVILGHFLSHLYLDRSSIGMQPRGNAVREARKLLSLFYNLCKNFLKRKDNQHHSQLIYRQMPTIPIFGLV